MAALLVAMSVMAVMMTVAMPVWKQISQREKEEELVFRGEQYARAIGLFHRKFANAAPPNIDVLVEQRFLRKKYKDPITNDDFVPVAQAQNAPGTTPTGSSAATPGAMPTTPSASPPTGRGAAPSRTTSAPGSQVGGIAGVTSKSKNTSIRIYKGRSHYNEWQFVYTPPAPAPGTGAPAGGAPGQRGQTPGRGGAAQPPPSTTPFGGGGLGGRGGRGSGPTPNGPQPPRPGR